MPDDALAGAHVHEVMGDPGLFREGAVCLVGVGDDPRHTDVPGRTYYVRASYSF